MVKSRGTAARRRILTRSARNAVARAWMAQGQGSFSSGPDFPQRIEVARASQSIVDGKNSGEQILLISTIGCGWHPIVASLSMGLRRLCRLSRRQSVCALQRWRPRCGTRRKIEHYLDRALSEDMLRCVDGWPRSTERGNANATNAVAGGRAFCMKRLCGLPTPWLPARAIFSMYEEGNGYILWAKAVSRATFLSARAGSAPASELSQGSKPDQTGGILRVKLEGG